MNTHTYPGRGLSLSQLILALNEELKRVAYCPSFALDAVSQLDNDTSIALATIREWRNTFASINRVPSEVLSLIPTHLPHDKDIFHATSVCRHWRKTFIQHAALWSRLNLTARRSNCFVKTLLERAKGSALDIYSARFDHADVLALLSPHAQRFRSLSFAYSYWPDIQKLSDAVSGPLPLLRTLELNVITPYTLGPDTIDPPSLPLFSGAVNLKEFVFHPEGGPSFLNHFAFSNLTTFELSAMPDDEIFYAPQLLDFLEASPTLQVVLVTIRAEILLADVPPERVIVLPNVETFSLTQHEPGYKIMTHISCPSARLTSFVREQDAEEWMLGETFPSSVTWNMIGPQYMAYPVDEVALGITTDGDAILSCSISFLSPGPAILRLGYKMTAEDEGRKEKIDFLGEKHFQVFSKAFKAARNHPLLNNVKRLRIWDEHPYPLTEIADEAVLLFGSVGPLEGLTLDVADLQLYLAPFLDRPEFRGAGQSLTFPSVKELTISIMDDEGESAIVELAKSQCTRSEPFERVILHMRDPPAAMIEKLELWVGTVHVEEMAIGKDPDSM